MAWVRATPSYRGSADAWKNVSARYVRRGGVWVPVATTNRGTPQPAYTPPPVVDPPPVSQGVLLGAYMDTPRTSDQLAYNLFGKWPQIASGYYDGGVTINVADQTARINRGIVPVVTISTKSTGGDTNDYIAAIQDPSHPQHTDAMDWLDIRTDQMVTIAKVRRDRPCYYSFDHEHDVKYNKATSPYAGLASAQPAVFGRAWSIFSGMTKAKAEAEALENVRMLLWYGGSNLTAVRDSMAQISVPNAPDALAYDPYQINGDWPATIADTFRNRLNQTRNAGGTVNEQWVRLGRPPIGMGEFAIARYNNKTNNGAGAVVYDDTEMATYYGGTTNNTLRAQADALGLAFMILFHRDSGDNARYQLNNSDPAYGGTRPQAAAAYGQAL